MTTEQALLEKCKHDFWGKAGDEFYRYSCIEDAIEAAIEYYCEAENIEELIDVNGIFYVSGGDAHAHHISRVMRNSDDAIEILDKLVGCASIKGACRNIDEKLEERYAECVMEINTFECDAYTLPPKLSKSLSRIFYREAKRYKAPFYEENEAAMRRIANTLLRRYQRAVRHLPVQRWGRLFNCHEYEVTIKLGELVNIERIDREEASK